MSVGLQCVRCCQNLSSKNDTSPLIGSELDENVNTVQEDLSARKRAKCIILMIFIVLVICTIATIVYLFITDDKSSTKHNLLFVNNTNGFIYTMDEHYNITEAFCVDITDSIFLHVGNNTDVYEKCSSIDSNNFETLDANGYTILPGLIDAHAHIMSLGQNFFRADLSSAQSTDDIINILQTFIDNNAPFNESMWLQGWGWDQNNWQDWDSADLPTRWMLDKNFTNIKIYLRRIDGHASWINTAALNFVPPFPDEDPDGGTIVRDEYGNITGSLIDRAMDLITPYISPFTLSQRFEMLRLVLEECVSNGLTGIHDSGTVPEDVELFLTVIDNPMEYNYSFSLRVTSFADAKAPGGYLPSDYKQLFFYKRLFTMNGVKFRMDGALGSWGAAFIQPYCDHTNDTGLLMYDDIDIFYKNISMWHEEGYQITVHCIGDIANRLTIDQYIRLINDYNLHDVDHRLRIEHAQIVNISVDLPKMVQYHIIPSMQPTHCTSDMIFAGDRLNCSEYGNGNRLSGAYAWQTMLDAGVNAIPFGSDFPSVGVVNPFLGIYAAVTRQNENGEPIGGWIPNNKISLYQAVKGYTLDAAYGSFQEDYLGSISEGKYADFIIIDRDIMALSQENYMDILDTNVIETYLGGERVYSNPEFE
eukprot:152396_1